MLKYPFFLLCFPYAARNSRNQKLQNLYTTSPYPLEHRRNYTHPHNQTQTLITKTPTIMSASSYQDQAKKKDDADKRANAREKYYQSEDQVKRREDKRKLEEALAAGDKKEASRRAEDFRRQKYDRQRAEKTKGSKY